MGCPYIRLRGFSVHGVRQGVLRCPSADGAPDAAAAPGVPEGRWDEQSRAAQLAIRLLLASHTAVVADFVEYWSLSIPGELGDLLARIGFVVELNAVGVLLFASAVYGSAAARFGVLPRWAARTLVAMPVVAYYTGNSIVAYVPNAFVVPLSLAWAAIGIWLIRAVNRTDRPWPTTIIVHDRPPMTLRTTLKTYWVTVSAGFLGAFMLVLGLLVLLPDEEGTDLLFGSLGIGSGVMLLSVLSLLDKGRIHARSARRLVAAAIAVAILGFFWSVVPLIAGGVVAWSGLHKGRLMAESRVTRLASAIVVPSLE